eukprot:TRINITY_DN23494_c0_g2_i1.p1 TRINITY_DN23494_c0_g2~~TRINITY_DN23494_c0_g2_i1.p1  ORF type:complete len:651 (+),score=119.71 TRINITY_DN23494_c0_g2_i1:217-1953(+)
MVDAEKGYRTGYLCYDLMENAREATCIYGLTSAMGCIARMCARELPAGRKIPEEDAGEGSMEQFCSTVFKMLHIFVTGFANYLEFLEDSGWPWTLRSLWHALGEYTSTNWSPEDSIVDHVASELRRQASRRQELSLHNGGRFDRRSGAVKIFALSMHAGLIREPLLWWRTILAQASDGKLWLEVRLPAGGSGALCDSEAGEACGARDPSFAALVERHITQRFPIAATGSNYVFDTISSLADLRADIWSLYADAMRAADVLLCGEPLAFCALFESVGRPVVAYIGNEPLFYLSPGDVGAALESLDRLARLPGNVLLGISPTIAVWMEQHSGTPVVTATPRGMHVGSATYGYRLSSGEVQRVFLTKRVTATFDDACIIRLLLRFSGQHVATPYAFRFDHLEELKGDDRSFQSWARMFRAALLLPMDWLQMIIFDLYALGLPIFVPHPTQRLPTYIFRRNAARAKKYSSDTVSPVRPGHTFEPARPFPFRLPFSDSGDPWDLHGGGGWDALRAWSLLTDFATLPHIRHFTSVAELVDAWVDDEGLRRTSQAMIAAHREASIGSALLWRSVLSGALEQTSGN